MDFATKDLNIDESIKQKVDKWLGSSYDNETRNEIRSLIENNNTNELIDAFYQDLEFGTGGLRGIMGVGTNRMNKYTVGMATQGLSNYLLQNFPNEQVKVAVAHDSRNNSRQFAEIVANIFAANGIKVYLFESLRPTPELSFAIRELGCHSGVNLTASHNPKEYNGYKAYWQGGAQLVAPHDKNVIAEVNKINDVSEIKFEGGKENIEIIGSEIDEKYIQKVLGLSVSKDAIRRQHNIKIVYTPIHGTGIKLVPKVLERFGFTNVHIVEEQSEPNGNFPTVVYPNPEEAEALTLALRKAKEIDADLVLATDPDADRVGIAVKNHHNEWQLLNGNQTAALLFYYMLSAWQNANKLTGNEYIVKTIVTSDILEVMAKDYGVEAYNTLTGFKYIADIIKNNEGKKTYIVGGEESYGYLIGDFVRDKDAVSACALIAELVAYAKDQGMTIFDMLVEMYTRFGFYKESLISLTKKGKSGAEEIQKMMAELRSNPPVSINGSRLEKLIDYQAQVSKNMKTGQEENTGTDKSNVLQFITEDGSKISARPSGTEPKIKFYFSVNEPLDSKNNYDEVNKKLDSKISAIIKDMKLS
jgi:phosphoglucomutase